MIALLLILFLGIYKHSIIAMETTIESLSPTETNTDFFKRMGTQSHGSVGEPIVLESATDYTRLLKINKRGSLILHASDPNFFTNTRGTQETYIYTATNDNGYFAWLNKYWNTNKPIDKVTLFAISENRLWLAYVVANINDVHTYKPLAIQTVPMDNLQQGPVATFDLKIFNGHDPINTLAISNDGFKVAFSTKNGVYLTNMVEQSCNKFVSLPHSEKNDSINTLTSVSRMYFNKQYTSLGLAHLGLRVLIPLKQSQQ